MLMTIDDLKRKKFFMIQMSYFLAPKKNKNFVGLKYFPSMNMTCPVSIRTWIALRKCL